MARHYVVGFLFNDLRDTVLMIRKSRPAWQYGRLNGIGGKVESGESARKAMVREFYEEAGVETDGSLWEHIAQLTGGDDYTVAFFRAVSSDVLSRTRTQTDEALVVTSVTALGAMDVDVVPNVRWLVPFAARPGVRLPLILIDDGSTPSARELSEEQSLLQITRDV